MGLYLGATSVGGGSGGLSDSGIAALVPNTGTATGAALAAGYVGQGVPVAGDILPKSGRPAFDLVAFGGDPTGAAFSDAAWTALVAALPSTRGARITAWGSFKFASPLATINVPIQLSGGGGPMTSSTRAGTLFSFPNANTAGLTLGVNAATSTIENIYFLGTATALGTADGITSLCRFKMYNVVVDNFSRDGLHMDTTAAAGNCNSSAFYGCRFVRNFRHGRYLVGTDCNATLFANCSSVSNGGWGLWNGNNTQNNVAINEHHDSNTLGPIYENGQSNHYYDPYDEHATECVIDTNANYSYWTLGATTASPTVLDLSSGTQGHVITRGGKTTTVLKAGVPVKANMLTWTRARMGSGVGTFWTGQSNIGTITFDSTITIDGFPTMQVPSAAAGNVLVSGSYIPVRQGVSYTITGRVLAAPATTGRQVRFEAGWYNGTTSISTPTGALVTDDPTTPATITFTGVAPAGATQIRINYRILSTGAAGEVHTLTDVRIAPTTAALISVDPINYAVTTADSKPVGFPGVITPVLVQPRAAQTLSVSGAVTIDASAGDPVITLAANATSSTITNPSVDQVLRVTWLQDATGGRTYSWPTNCKFADGTTPTDTTAGRAVTVTFRYDGTNWLELSHAVAGSTAATGLGICRVTHSGLGTGAVTIGSANTTRFYRVVEGGTISKVRVFIGTSSGNIAVAAYANTGTGLAAVPGTQLATSGSVASPGTGVQDVALGASVTLAVGDWLAVAADNATVTFTGINGGGDSTGSAGLAGSHSVFPPSATPTFTAGNNRLIGVVGVP